MLIFGHFSVRLFINLFQHQENSTFAINSSYFMLKRILKKCNWMLLKKKRRQNGSVRPTTQRGNWLTSGHVVYDYPIFVDVPNFAITIFAAVDLLQINCLSFKSCASEIGQESDS